MIANDLKTATTGPTVQSEPVAQPKLPGITPSSDFTSNNDDGLTGISLPNPGNLMLGAALSYAQMGLAIVPARHRDKKPILPKWPDLASSDTSAIESWFADQYPGYNIALATGSKSGNVIAIDVDVKPNQGTDGMQAVAAWQKEHGAWPKTPVSITGSGGRHFLFRVPETFGNSACAGLGVDIRGERGCIVLPPSIHPNGNVYRWETSPEQCPIADANESVLGFIRFVQDNSDNGKHAASATPWKRLQHVPEGMRDDELFRACCHWRALGRNKKEMEREALAYNEESFDPPLSEEEVLAKVKHVIEAYPSGKHTPRPKELAEFEPSSQMVNDKDLSRLFARTYRSCLCYVKEEGDFYFHNGAYWERDVGHVQTRLLCKDFTDRLMERRDEISDEDDRRNYVKKLANYGNQNSRERLIKDSMPELAVDAGCFDKDPVLLNVLNGTIDLRTGKLRQHRAEDMLTKCAPVRYDESTRSELWESTLADIFEGDLDTMQSFQMALGRMLMCDTAREQFYIVGFEPRSGKSLVFGELCAILGTGESGYVCAVPSDTFEQPRGKMAGQSAREDIMMMRGARLIISSEPKQGMMLDCGLIKLLTGHDPVTARRLYRGLVTFTCVGTIFIVTNHMPQIPDKTIYESERMVVFPFNHHVPEEQQDKTLKTRLAEPEEMSGVLNWLLEGVRMCREGDEAKPSDAMGKSFAAVIEANDHVGRFIREVLVEDPKSHLRGSDVHKAYQSWCSRQLLDCMGSVGFYDELREHGIQVVAKTKAARNVIRGYRLHSGEEQEDRGDTDI